MEDVAAHPSHVYRARLDRSGRIVLPLPVREELHLSTGDEVLVIQSSGSCRIETPEQALKAAQDYFCSLVPPGVSLVDELIADRRSEAAREEEERVGYETWQRKQRSDE